MAKAARSRLACILTPILLTLATLILLMIVGLGGVNQNNQSLNNLYFMRANTSEINLNNLLVTDLPSKIDTNNTTSSANVVSDFYHIGLWNYCSGNFKNETHFNNKDASKTDNVTNCTGHTTLFSFNLVEVWHLNQTEINPGFDKDLRNTFKSYQTVAKWMNIAYILTVTVTALEFLIGCLIARRSRWGSLIATIASIFSSIFILCFALTATVLYGSLVGTFNHVFTKYNIHGVMGFTIYVITWIAVLCSWVAGFFWLFSACCCGGRKKSKTGQEPPAQNNVQNIFFAGPGNQTPLQTLSPQGTPSGKKGKK